MSNEAKTAQQEVPQAAEPEVVAEVYSISAQNKTEDAYATVRVLCSAGKGYWDLPIRATDKLITLQSHRETIEKLQANGDAAVEIANNLLNQSAKKDAALMACMEALLACRYWSGQTTRPNQQFDGNAVAKALRKLLDIGAVPKNEQFRAELWIKDNAALTKAQEALK